MVTFEQAETAYEAENYETAFRIFMLLAQEGDIKAQISVASMYSAGHGVERNFAEAARWYRPAAEQGHLIAQNNLAVMLLLNDDPKESINWLLTAAEQGSPLAQSSLGDIYSESYNLSSSFYENLSDSHEALKWYQKAGQGGFPYASHRLGEMYANGQGITKDEQQAVFWYQKAAEDLYEPSQEVLAEAYRQGLLGLPCDPKQAEYWLNRMKTN